MGDHSTFIITRYLGDTAATHQNEIREKWKHTREIRQHFYNDVYLVAFQALMAGHFHWDVRPPNLAYSKDTYHVEIFDWEEVEGGLPQNYNSVLFKAGVAIPQTQLILDILFQCASLFIDGTSDEDKWAERLKNDLKHLFISGRPPNEKLHSLMQKYLDLGNFE